MDQQKQIAVRQSDKKTPAAHKVHQPHLKANGSHKFTRSQNAKGGKR